MKKLILGITIALMGFGAKGQQISNGNGIGILSNIPTTNLNVGINTRNPQSQLHVVGDIRIPMENRILFGQGGNGDGEWIQNTHNPTNPNPTSGTHGIGIFANSSERMRITNLGLVGIGTNNPTHTLHVRGNGMRIERNDYTNQDNSLEIGITSNIFGSQTLPPGTINFRSLNSTNGVNPDISFSANGRNHQLTLKNNGRLGLGIVNPDATFHIQTNKTLRAEQYISTGESTLIMGVAGNNGDYGIRDGDSMIWTNAPNNNFRSNLYINTGTQNLTGIPSNNPDQRSIVLGTLTRNVIVVNSDGRVGIGLDEHQPVVGQIGTVTQPRAMFHTNSRNKADIIFQNLPQTNCGYVVMVDDNGYMYRSFRKGNPCVDTGVCTATSSATAEKDIFKQFEELSKKYDALSKEVDTLKSKIK